jgi:hypothetical protein
MTIELSKLSSEAIQDSCIYAYRIKLTIQPADTHLSLYWYGIELYIDAQIELYIDS